MKRELKEQPGRLQFLHGIIIDLFVDNAKFKGQNVTAQVPQLQRVLNDYSLETMLGFFSPHDGYTLHITDLGEPQPR